VRIRTTVTLLLLILLVSPAAARDWLVPGEVATIAAAMDSATAGDAVIVACGTYEEHSISVASGITLRSETGLPNCVTIDAGQAGRNLVCDKVDENTVIIGFTLVGGHGDDGGALYCQSGNGPRVEFCVFDGAVSASGGGAVYCFGVANMIMLDCRFQGNEVQQGNGGAVYAHASTTTFTNCQFIGNTAQGDGGGMIVVEGSFTLNSCTFEQNNAGNYGGGLLTDTAAGGMADCQVIDNIAGVSGGGGSFGWAEVSLFGSTFSGNEAVGSGGGGMRTQGYSTITATECTFSGNSATSGAGIKAGSDLTLIDCYVNANAASSGAGAVSLFGDLHLEAENVDFLNNSAPDNAGGFIPENSTAYLRCCEVVEEDWRFWSAITLNNEGCDVADETTNWGSVKAAYR